MDAEAEYWLSRAFYQYPGHSDLARAYMELLRDRGKVSEALRVYHLHRNVVFHEYGLPPAEEIESLARSLSES